MSRVAKKPIPVPRGVEVHVADSVVSVKGPKGALQMPLPKGVTVAADAAQLNVAASEPAAWSQAGTVRANLQNLVTGVSQGFERRLELVGVGYRAQARGRTLNLQLGFSHPIDYQLPADVDAETPTQTEVVLRSASRQRLGQVAAEVRGFRPPEPYKGKGIRYRGEQVLRKEAKKK
jgi:large subunit ribosomal protein L6